MSTQFGYTKIFHGRKIDSPLDLWQHILKKPEKWMHKLPTSQPLIKNWFWLNWIKDSRRQAPNVAIFNHPAGDAGTQVHLPCCVTVKEQYDMSTEIREFLKFITRKNSFQKSFSFPFIFKQNMRSVGQLHYPLYLDFTSQAFCTLQYW